MLTPLFFCWMFVGAASFRLQTEESLTAVRGRNISLPCNFSVPALAVYWYKHTFTMFTGAPDDGALLVARYYRGITDPVTGFERFSITKDYSLIVRNVTVQDETTYSCQVVGIDTMDVDTERGYTDLRVIALAEPLEPIIEIIEPCTFTAQGGCVYHVNRSTIGKDTSDDVILVSKLFNVRPLPNLTWIQSDGGLNKNATYQTQEKDGLFSISSQVQVPKSHLDHNYTCQAKGEAVNGTSLVVISFEDSATHVSNDRVTTMIISVIITIIVLVIIIVIVILSVGLTFYRRHGRWPWLTIGPSADGVWTDADLVAYSVVVGVAVAIFLVSITLYCQLYFIRVGKIEEEAQTQARQAVAKKEAETKAQLVAAQKQKARQDIAAQKAKQKTR